MIGDEVEDGAQMTPRAATKPIFEVEATPAPNQRSRLRIWESTQHEGALYFQADQRGLPWLTEVAGGTIEFADVERLIDALHAFWNKMLQYRRREEAEVKVQELTIRRNAAKKKIEEAQEEIRRINNQLQEAQETLSGARPLHPTYVYDEEAHE